MRKIRELKNGVAVYISENSPNRHIAMFGISGSGKSTRITEILEDIVRNGETVIAFDINGYDYQGQEQYLNKISAIGDGLDFKFFDRTVVENGVESYANFVSYFVDNLGNVFNLGVRQTGALRIAVEFAIKHRDEFETEMQALAFGLESQSSAVAQGVYNKLWNLIRCNVFRKSNKVIRCGAVNIISFKGLNPSMQRELMEIVLCSLWKRLRIGDSSKSSMTIVIDEFQNLSLKKNSVLLEMLREARKYNLNLLLATQSNTGFSKEVRNAVNQTAIQLYFRPNGAEIKKVAEILEPQNANQWMVRLKTLKIGESVACGNVNICGKEMTKPCVICSHYGSENVVERGIALRESCGRRES